MTILKRTLSAAMVVLLAISALTGCSNSTKKEYKFDDVRVSDSDISKIESQVDDALRENEFIGSGAITINKQDIYSKSIGYADPIKKKKLTNKTPYHIGQLAMNITGAAVLMLEKSGKLNPKDTIDKYFSSQYGESLSKVTVEQLISNRVDFGSYATEIYNTPEEAVRYKTYLRTKNPDKYSVKISNMIVEHILRHGCKKGKQNSLSNYYLLGKIITKASGTSYRDYVQKNIFDKLSMKHTGFVSSKCKFAGYDMNNKVWHRFNEAPSVLNFGFAYSAFGLYSCADDMSAFYKALSNGELMDIDFMKKLKLAPSNDYCGFVRDGNNVSARSRVSVNCGYVHINIETKEVVTLLSNRVGKEDIKNTGDELYSILSSKINGIILSDINEK